MNKAKSYADLARGPIQRGMFTLTAVTTFDNYEWYVFETRLEDVFSPNIPQCYDGTLILPPISDPTPKIEHLALINPPSPPELPPTALLLFHGLIDRPQRLLFV